MNWNGEFLIKYLLYRIFNAIEWEIALDPILFFPVKRFWIVSIGFIEKKKILVVILAEKCKIEVDNDYFQIHTQFRIKETFFIFSFLRFGKLEYDGTSFIMTLFSKLFTMSAKSFAYRQLFRELLLLLFFVMWSKILNKNVKMWIIDFCVALKTFRYFFFFHCFRNALLRSLLLFYC